MVEASAAPQQGSPYEPPGPTPLVFEGFNGLNTQPSRPGIGDDQCFILDGFFPIGKNNARTMPGISSAQYTAPSGKTLEWFDFGNIETTPYGVLAISDGSLIAINTNTLATTTIGGAGTVNPQPAQIAMSQWGNQYLLIINSEGYFIWDGTILYYASASSNTGTIAPSITVTNGGSGYTTAPSVSFAGGSGTGATAVAALDNGAVSSVTLTNPGSGYLQSDNTVVSVDVTSPGSGYTAAPTVAFSGPGAGATAIANIFAGGVSGVTITDGGTGYQSDTPPTIAFVGGGGSGAAATAEVNYGVIPVIFTGGVGSGATATATISGGAVTSISVTAGGSGYSSTEPPTITLDPGTNAGSGATALAEVSGGAVSSIVVTSGGSGYTVAPTVIFTTGGATGVANLMPFGVTGTAIEVYAGRVWIADTDSVTFSAPGSVSDFSTSDGGGSFESNDSFLRVNFTNLKQTNGFLYLIADSSINYISGVQTSGTPPTTTFTNQNADPEIGSAWAGTVDVFSRNIIMANPWGAFISYGGAVTKISEALDGIYNTVGNIANNFTFGVYEPTSAKAIVYGKRIWVLLLTIKDQVTGTVAPKLLVYDGKSWFTTPQDVTLIFIQGQEINSIQTAWGTDGNSLYKLFYQPSTGFVKTIQSKLWSQPGGIHILKTPGRLWGVAQFNTILSPTLSVYVDNEDGIGGTAYNWTASATGPISFPPFAVGQWGSLIGLTLQTSEGDLQLVLASLGIEPYQYRG